MEDKLLLANNEEHLFNILNEKIVWNNNENSNLSLNKKQLGLTTLEIEEACKKFYKILNESQEKFLKNSPTYTEFLINKKKSESDDSKNFRKIIENQTSNELLNQNQLNEEFNLEKNLNTKPLNDNELLCEDEVFI